MLSGADTGEDFSRRMKGMNTCQVLDEDKTRCRKAVFKTVEYFGDYEIYATSSIRWVKIGVCRDHYNKL